MPRWHRVLGHTTDMANSNHGAGRSLMTYVKSIVGRQSEVRGANGSTFYVDLNRANDDGNGLSWKTAFQKIATGLAASDADIGLSANRAWAKRNTVYVCGDGIAEALVLGAEKTDLVGVGYDIGHFPKVTGNFTIGTAVNGFRIFNMGFIPTTTAPAITFPTGMYGWGVHSCHFYKAEGVTASAVVLATNTAEYHFCDNVIYPDVAAVRNTIGLSLVGARADRGMIANNQIEAAEAIDVNVNVTQGQGSMIRDNILICTGLAVDDNSSDFFIVRNMIISDADNDTMGNIIDEGTRKAVGNIVVGSSSAQTHPFAAVT